MPQLRAHWTERKAIDPDTGCWNWTGGINNRGYGKAGNSTVHRLSFETMKGPIPPGMEVDHLCRNRRCFNPDHLEAVTHAENMLRSPRARSSTHCPKGHDFAEAGYWVTATGRWKCKKCREQWRPRKTPPRQSGDGKAGASPNLPLPKDTPNHDQ